MNNKKKKDHAEEYACSPAEAAELYRKISGVLCELYPSALCALEYGGEPWRLVVMARLSAQCTDARVNEVCRELFSVYPTAKALACAPISEVERLVRPCGLYRRKAYDIVAECRDITEKHGGRVPSDMDELLELPGVGRKIANLVMGDVHGLGGVVCDTHFIRICGRLGFYDEALRAPDKIERLMERVIPRAEQSAFCHRIVQFGRDICSARGEKCGKCPARAFCRRSRGGTDDAENRGEKAPSER